MDNNSLKQLLEKHTERATSVSEEELLKTYFEQQDNVYPDFNCAQGIFTHFIAEKIITSYKKKFKLKKQQASKDCSAWSLDTIRFRYGMPKLFE